MTLLTLPEWARPPRCSALARDGRRCRRLAAMLAAPAVGRHWRCRSHRSQAVRLKWAGRRDELDVLGACLPGNDPIEAAATVAAAERRATP